MIYFHDRFFFIHWRGCPNGKESTEFCLATCFGNFLQLFNYLYLYTRSARDIDKLLKNDIFWSKCRPAWFCFIERRSCLNSNLQTGNQKQPGSKFKSDRAELLSHHFVGYKLCLDFFWFSSTRYKFVSSDRKDSFQLPAIIRNVKGEKNNEKRQLEVILQ